MTEVWLKEVSKDTWVGCEPSDPGATRFVSAPWAEYRFTQDDFNRIGPHAMVRELNAAGIETEGSGCPFTIKGTWELLTVISGSTIRKTVDTFIYRQLKTNRLEGVTIVALGDVSALFDAINEAVGDKK